MLIATGPNIRNEANKQIKQDQASYRKRILKSFKGKPKCFYGYMQKLKTVKDKVARLTTVNGKLTETDEEAAHTLGSCFSSVFVHEAPIQTDTNGSDVQEQDTDCPEIVVDEEKVRSKLLALKEDKAQGPDDIHPAVLKNCADTVAKPLSIIFNKSLQEGTVPQAWFWKLATVCPIFKKGDRSDPGNYRPVSLTLVPCKVLESVIRDELSSYLEKKGF